MVDEETLKNDLTAAQKKIEHLTEVLFSSWLIACLLFVVLVLLLFSFLS